MSTMIVHLPVKAHHRFKRRCLEMDVYQGEVVKILIELFTSGRLNITDGKIEDVVMTTRGIQRDDICGVYNAASYVGISYQTIRRLIAKNKLKAKKNAPSYGGLIFKKKDLDRLRDQIDDE